MDTRLLLALILTALVVAGFIASPLFLLWLSRRSLKRQAIDNLADQIAHGDVISLPRGAIRKNFAPHSSGDNR